MSFRRIAAAAALLVVPAASHAQIGGTYGYNVFVFESFLASGSETNGRLLVGHNANLSSYSTGKSVGDNSLYSLVVGDTLTANGWGIQHGNGYARVINGSASSAPSLNWAPGAPRITAGGTAPITAAQIAAERLRLENLSAGLGALAQSAGATVTEASGTWTFAAATPVIPTAYVFNVDASLFNNACTVNVNIPTLATAIINVFGASAQTTQCGMFVNGGGNSGDASTPAAGRVLWNYVDATSLNFRGGIMGSILAPNATATMAWSQGVGDIVVKDLTNVGGMNGNQEWYVRPFDGTIPPITTTATPEPATLVLSAGGLLLLAGAQRIRRRKA